MSQWGVGVDLSGDKARIVRVQYRDTTPQITLSTAPTNDWRNSIDSLESRVTIVIDDRLSNVRIVRPAIIEPSSARDAAEYETRASMLAGDSDLLIEVNHIGNSNDPRAWLAVSTHARAAVTGGAPVSDIPGTVSARCLPRSVALGRGYLFGCEIQAADTTIVIEPGQSLCSICFLNSRAVVGTAHLRGVSSEATDSDLAAWFAELQMVVQYRLATDLVTTPGSNDAHYVWAGDSRIANKLTAITGALFTPPKLKELELSPESEVTSLTADWLAALGAALN